ncbi:MAG: hypothetical protein M0T75_05210 [Chloroflexi bacterium]|nr:hypothetical protein [Chloroflexota bacterium]
MTTMAAGSPSRARRWRRWILAIATALVVLVVGVGTAVGAYVGLAAEPPLALPAGRRDGSALDIVGSIPVVFSDWGIEEPRGYGVLADRGVAEFRLVLRRG